MNRKVKKQKTANVTQKYRKYKEQELINYRQELRRGLNGNLI